MAKTSTQVLLDAKEVIDAIVAAARQHAGAGVGGSTATVDVGEDGKVLGARVEFQKTGK